MTYVVVETVIVAGWAAVCWSRLKDRSLRATEQLHVLLYSIPIAIVMEIRNEILQQETGVYYPYSLGYFPGFNFPIAIALSSSLFAWLVYALSRAGAVKLVGKDRGASMRFAQGGLLLLLLTSNTFFEYLGPAIGYWQWRQPLPAGFGVWLAKYLFYLWFVGPPAVVAVVLAGREPAPAPLVLSEEGDKAKPAPST